MLLTPIQSWRSIGESQCLESGISFCELHARLAGTNRLFIHDKNLAVYKKLFVGFDKSEFCCSGERGSDVLKGRFSYFGHHSFSSGFPPDWFYNPFSKEKFPSGAHWSKIDDFARGDIKALWELNRFGFVFPLVRAYYRSQDDRYVRAFWELVEDWNEKNPPNQGPNWRCGQEISFRLFAWIFGLFAFLQHKESTPRRVEILLKMIYVSAKRIHANIDYALSQQNNHAISEAAGLWTVGVLFPEFRNSHKWLKTGYHLLEKLAQELVYADGSFVQHSVAYHRLMLYDYLWAIRLGEVNGYFFSENLKDKLKRSVVWLYQLLDTSSGRVPHYGHDDGSLIIPLNNCEHRDYRPILQAMHYLLTGKRLFDSGPWDEGLFWLWGVQATKAPVVTIARENLSAEAGGYYTFRAKNSYVFTRCATFRHRPGQADMLHADLWWKDLNIALDPGTFSYNPPANEAIYFEKTSMHNSVTVDGRDQMDRIGRFIWLPWLRSKVDCQKSSTEISCWQGQHDGYHRLRSGIDHIRCIIKLPDDCWLFIDRLEGRRQHIYQLHWLFDDFKHQWNARDGLILITARGKFYCQAGCFDQAVKIELSRADGFSAKGWQSPYYFTKTPALSWLVQCSAPQATFWTLMGPRKMTMKQKNEIISDSWKVVIAWGEGDLVVREIILTGMKNDRLSL